MTKHVVVTLCILTSLAGRVCLSQNLVRDIQPGSTNPSGMRSTTKMFAGSGVLYFAANNTEGGVEELWTTDGTSGGAQRILQFTGETSSSVIDGFALLPNGSALITAGTSLGYGTELHISDGTTAGTSLIRDIFPGRDAGCVELLGSVGSQFLFSGNNGTTGYELWKSDGTNAGTQLVADIASGPDSSLPREGVEFQGSFFFSAYSPATDRELWRTDGTAAGTTLLADINSSGGSSPSKFTVLGATLLFAASSSSDGRELWQTDGTTAGTTLLADLMPGNLSSSPRDLTVFGGECYFVANDGTLGRELWKTDGTTVTLVRDIRSGGSSSDPRGLHVANGKLLFRANDGVSGRELWCTDGTTAGTQLVADLSPGSASTLFNGLADGAASNGSVLVFSAQPSFVGAPGEEPYVSDGTAAGTMLLRDINPGPSSDPTAFTAWNGDIYFSANDGVNGRELWKTDGTPAGTTLLHDVGTTRGNSSGIRNLTALGDLVVFSADDGVNGEEPWVSDGTPAGTQLLANLSNQFTNPNDFFPFAGRVYFRASSPSTGSELWATNGTPAGTVLVTDIQPGTSGSSPRRFVEWNGDLYFLASNVQPRAYRTNGTTVSQVSSVTLLSTAPSPILPIGNQLLLLTPQGPFVSDGTPAGTAPVDAGNPVIPYSNAAAVAIGNTAYFFGSRGAQHDLWRTDGTAAGTRHVFQFTTAPYTSVSSEFLMAAVGDRLFIVSRDGNPAGSGPGRELWTSDGTTAGTILLKDIQPFPGADSVPAGLTPATDRLFFHAFDPIEGRELWVTDGTSLGTQSVLDLMPGIQQGADGEMRQAGMGRRVVFFGREPSTGGELWISDGTASGTTQLFDLNPGPASGATTTPPVVAGNQVFFIGNNGVSGEELYVAPIALLEASQAAPIGQGCTGSNGVPQIAAEGIPAVGNTNFAIELGNAQPSLPALLLGSETRTDVPLGGGCTLYPTGPSVTIAVTVDAAGFASVAVPVPNTAALVGATLTLQWAAIDLGGAFQNVAAFSRGLQVIIGRS